MKEQGVIVVMAKLEGLTAPENCIVLEKHKPSAVVWGTFKQEEPVCCDKQEEFLMVQL